MNGLEREYPETQRDKKQLKGVALIGILRQAQDERVGKARPRQACQIIDSAYLRLW
ncbi:MAG: hypothetical protein LBD67_10210 [Candidatus Accumulibacter sp.]|jgi:hypothetical protein|nr:hypothetical protein [Accumulibacter sp.]